MDSWESFSELLMFQRISDFTSMDQKIQPGLTNRDWLTIRKIGLCELY